MPDTLTADDFIMPGVGAKLVEEWFPSINLPEQVEAWLQEGRQEAEGEQAIRAWVYWQAFDHVATRLNMSFTTQDVEWKGNFRRSDKQLDFFKQKADEWQEKFENLTEEEASPSRRRTTVVSKNVVW